MKRHITSALTLLLLGLAMGFGWQIAPEYRSDIWNITSAVYKLALLVWIAILAATWETMVVCCLLMVFELQIAACSMAYLWEPWVTQPGDELCSSKLNIPLGIAGAVVALGLVLFLVKAKNEPGR